MALDDSVRQFVNELLELQPIYLISPVGEPMPMDSVRIRLVRLWSFGGRTRGGVGRIEFAGNPLNGFWITFSSPNLETFDFTGRLTRYQVHVTSEEPQESVEPGVPLPTLPLAGGFAQISAVGAGPIPARYPEVSAEIRAQLEAIPVSVDQLMPYRPCDVVLKDRRRIDCVYVVPEEPYILMWGVWPEANASVAVDDLATVVESRHRLPAPFARKLYAAGESGMGYTIFTVVFDDGSRIAVQTGNAIDFVNYPVGKGPANVTDVLPHVGRGDPQVSSAPAYRWCLYAR